MSDKKEITHEELLELVSGGSLKHNYQANLDEMMANYETINTKEEFLAGFEKRWREHIGKSACATSTKTTSTKNRSFTKAEIRNERS